MTRKRELIMLPTDRERHEALPADIFSLCVEEVFWVELVGLFPQRWILMTAFYVRIQDGALEERNVYLPYYLATAEKKLPSGFYVTKALQLSGLSSSLTIK